MNKYPLGNIKTEEMKIIVDRLGDLGFSCATNEDGTMICTNNLEDSTLKLKFKYNAFTKKFTITNDYDKLDLYVKALGDNHG